MKASIRVGLVMFSLVLALTAVTAAAVDGFTTQRFEVELTGPEVSQIAAVINGSLCTKIETDLELGPSACNAARVLQYMTGGIDIKVFDVDGDGNDDNVIGVQLRLPDTRTVTIP